MAYLVNLPLIKPDRSPYLIFLIKMYSEIGSFEEREDIIITTSTAFS